MAEGERRGGKLSPRAVVGRLAQRHLIRRLPVQALLSALRIEEIEQGVKACLSCAYTGQIE